MQSAAEKAITELNQRDKHKNVIKLNFRIALDDGRNTLNLNNIFILLQPRSIYLPLDSILG